jgi:hypothetical protein
MKSWLTEPEVAADLGCHAETSRNLFFAFHDHGYANANGAASRRRSATSLVVKFGPLAAMPF